MDPTTLPLRDIHLPSEPGWWPLAPGWWLIVAAILLLALTLIARRVWQRRARIRAAQHALATIRKRYRASGDAAYLIGALSDLLRRAHLTVGGRTDVAALTGIDWLKWLDGDNPERPFSEGVGHVLAYGPYQNPASLPSALDGENLLAVCDNALKETLRP